MEILWIAVTVAVGGAALASLGLRPPKITVDDDAIRELGELDRAIDAKADALDARLSALKATVASISTGSANAGAELPPLKKAVIERVASHLAEQKATRIEMDVWPDRAELLYGSGSLTTFVAHRDHVAMTEWGDTGHVPARAGLRAWEADAEEPTRAADRRPRHSLLHPDLDFELETGTVAR